MTKQQAIADFKKNVLPFIKRRYESNGRKDWPARREAWNNYTDDLHKSGVITDRQVNNWGQPAFCNPSK